MRTTAPLRREPLAGGAVASLSTLLFLWWSQCLLLGGRIRWRALFPGAVVTVIGLLGLRVFSRLVFSPLIASNTVTYGPVGTVLVIKSWLVGVGVVAFGGALAGRLLYEELSRMAPALKRRTVPARSENTAFATRRASRTATRLLGLVRLGAVPPGGGERARGARGAGREVGPSPRVRGAASNRLLPILGEGTIPAGAGSSGILAYAWWP